MAFKRTRSSTVSTVDDKELHPAINLADTVCLTDFERLNVGETIRLAKSSFLIL